jgi:hypothetical protein
MQRGEFKRLFETELRTLFERARSSDELSFLFAILGINSGEEDVGWQPINETNFLVRDLVGLINGPLYDDVKVRIALLLYCHVIEASYLYHCIYNLLLTIERNPPKVFNFLEKYRNGVPPAMTTKISEIISKATQNGFVGFVKIFDQIVKPDIRNAFFHSDYILFNGELRLKHRGSQIARIPYADIFQLVEKTIDFFNGFMDLLLEARRSFPKDYKITNRKTPSGQNLSSVTVLTDDNGIAIGFEGSDSLPIW